MLTGKAAFDGETITDRLAAVVRAEPDWTLLPEKTPRRIRELLRRCLVKDPKQRLQAIGEARIAPEKSLNDPDVENAAPMAVASRKREWMFGVFGLAGILAAVVLAVLRWSPAVEKPRVVRAYLKPVPGTSYNDYEPAIGVRIVARRIAREAYVALNTADGKISIWVRPIDSLKAQILPGTEGGSYPFWSADSRSIGSVRNLHRSPSATSMARSR